MYLSETQVGRWAALRSWDMSCGCCVLFIPFRRKRGSSTRSGNASGKRVLENFEIYPKRSLTAAFPRTRSRSSLVAGWSSLVARQAHNLKVVGSNPTPAPNLKPPELLPGVSALMAYAIFERATTRVQHQSTRGNFGTPKPNIAPNIFRAETQIFALSSNPPSVQT